MDIYVIDATITNSSGDSVTLNVSTQYEPISPEWKKAYRPIALELAAKYIDLHSNGMRVKWIEAKA